MRSREFGSVLNFDTEELRVSNFDSKIEREKRSDRKGVVFVFLFGHMVLCWEANPGI